MNVLYFELSNIAGLFFYMETYILNNEWISVFRLAFLHQWIAIDLDYNYLSSLLCYLIILSH